MPPLRAFLAATLALFSPAIQAESPITHSYAVFGGAELTQIISGSGEVLWRYPASTRDGFVLPNGNLLLTLSKSKEYPGGAIVEVTRANKVVFSFKGTQSEVNTAQPLPNGNIVFTEAGGKPRLLEITREGKVVTEFPLEAQTANAHLQSRMARKLPNGHYLVPQLLDKVVREYTSEGKVVWEFMAPAEPKDCWPFSAIRRPDGQHLFNLTHGNTVVITDAEGQILWKLSNEDFPEPILKDPCGAQWLPNGNVVIACHAAKGDAIKLFEVTREKNVVWSVRDSRLTGIHTFQILDTNGVPLEGAPMK
jgi:outer membrane protein assembly factor BamB